MFTFWVIFLNVKILPPTYFPSKIKVFAKLSSQARSLFKTGQFKGFIIFIKKPDV
jgi:membrane glycosyltransferase